VYIPSAEDEFVTLLLHCVLDKGRFEPKRRHRLQWLCDEIADEEYVDSLLKANWSPIMSWPSLESQVEAGEWKALLAERKTVANFLASRDRLGTIGRRARDKVLRKLNRWASRWRPRALTVALLAPDGAGKSTVVKGVQVSFYFPVRSMYMGLYQGGGKRARRLKIPGLGLSHHMLTQWGRYLVARYHQLQGRLVIFDRYTYDALLPPRKPLDLLRRARRWLLGHACPAPDVIILLDAPGEMLFARKGEHSATVLEEQRQGYLRLRQRLHRMVVVDATKSADSVRRDVTGLIWRVYTKQFSFEAGQ
jgi:thymidylate kinase